MESASLVAVSESKYNGLLLSRPHSNECSPLVPGVLTELVQSMYLAFSLPTR